MPRRGGELGADVGGVERKEFPGALKTIYQRHPGAILLARTRAAAEATVLRAVQAGVMGFLSAETDGAEIVTAIQTVRGGDPYLPLGVTNQFVRGIQQAYREAQRGVPFPGNAVESLLAHGMPSGN